MPVSRPSRTPDARQLLNYAVWLLARRECAAAELLAKFRGRFISNEELFAATLAKLQALGMQSDERAGRTFVESHAGWGVTRLRLELTRRGITPDLIATLLSEGTDELARARDVLGLKLRGKELPREWKERQKLAAFLARRGFSLDVVRKVVKD